MALHQPHDKQLFSALRNHQVARDAIRAHVPHSLLSQINLEQLRLYKPKLVSPEYKAFEADVVYEIPFKDQSGLFLFHCEHQSKPEKYLSLRIWQYVFLLLMEYAENHASKPLPIVYPMIFYTGERQYLEPLSIFELFDDKSNLVKQLWLEPIHLVDVCRLPDEEIKRHGFFGLSEYTFKHKNTRQFNQFLRVFLPWLEEGLPTMGLEYMRALLRYVLDVFPNGSYAALRDEAAEQSVTKSGETGMTIAHELKQIGREEGMQQGRQEGEAHGKRAVAINLIKEHVDERLIAKATGMTLEQVRQLKSELIEV